MTIALYHPVLGYYSSSRDKLGEKGDFVTAPVMGTIFAKCLANQCRQVLDQIENGSILEFGAGDASLAANLLSELQTQNALPDKYLILEVSADLKARQLEKLSALGNDILQRVEWVETLPAGGFKGIMIANEVLDAMPVQRFRIDDKGKARELGVALHENEFCWIDLENQLADEYLSRLKEYDLSTGYESEINRQAEAWVVSVAESLAQGLVLIIDYGFPGHEYYHPQRSTGTLMCHHLHRANDDPFWLPGEQDITSHVDFSAILKSAETAGLNALGYTSQGNFLLGCGVLDLLTDMQSNTDSSPEMALAISQEIKKLTLPHEMGELFKVLALSKNYESPLSGFSFKNNLHRL